MTQTLATHRAGDPNDLDLLVGQWHVGRDFPGLFPMIEASCACPKARCGLAAPISQIDCVEHLGTRTMRQIHDAGNCETYMRKMRKRKTVQL